MWEAQSLSPSMCGEFNEKDHSHSGPSGEPGTGDRASARCPKAQPPRLCFMKHICQMWPWPQPGGDPHCLQVCQMEKIERAGLKRKLFPPVLTQHTSLPCGSGDLQAGDVIRFTILLSLQRGQPVAMTKVSSLRLVLVRSPTSPRGPAV